MRELEGELFIGTSFSSVAVVQEREYPLSPDIGPKATAVLLRHPLSTDRSGNGLLENSEYKKIMIAIQNQLLDWIEDIFISAPPDLDATMKENLFLHLALQERTDSELRRRLLDWILLHAETAKRIELGAPLVAAEIELGDLHEAFEQWRELEHCKIEGSSDEGSNWEEEARTISLLYCQILEACLEQQEKDFALQILESSGQLHYLECSRLAHICLALSRSCSGKQSLELLSRSMYYCLREEGRKDKPEQHSIGDIDFESLAKLDGLRNTWPGWLYQISELKFSKEHGVQTIECLSEILAQAHQEGKALPGLSDILSLVAKALRLPDSTMKRVQQLTVRSQAISQNE